MFENTSRRRFLRQAATVGAAAGLADLDFLGRLRPVSAAEATPDPNRVQMHPDIEPVVRLLEETPRDKLLEAVAERIHHGLSYRDVVAALLLAGVRNIQPRPVGFKFHAVLVVNSAHIASVGSPDEHRWLPIFWALDHFKDSQADDERQGDWTMQRVDETAVPAGDKSKDAFIAAMDNWDVAAADAAVAGFARHAGLNEIFEVLFRFGARDFRDIGHKAIYVANSLRTLNLIGQQHAEPVLRSLAYALLEHEGDNPAQRDAPADVPWRRNGERAGKLRADWTSGKPDKGATLEMLATLREADEHGSCDKVVEIINRGVHPQAVWDALLVGSGELLARQPGIVALHAVTTSNALRYAWNTSGNDETRRMLLLQNAAFVPMFRQAMISRGGKLKDLKLDELQPVSLSGGDRPPVDEIFADVSGDKMQAAGKVLSYLGSHPDPLELVDTARLLVFLKGSNAHDYKFSSAVLEDHVNVSPQWRAPYLASSVFNLRGSGGKDNALVARTRAALG
ncbi:MAG: twin-arginine translocation signal domain-containing protein [Pirellulales bacterium]